MAHPVDVAVRCGCQLIDGLTSFAGANGSRTAEQPTQLQAHDDRLGAVYGRHSYSGGDESRHRAIYFGEIRRFHVCTSLPVANFPLSSALLEKALSITLVISLVPLILLALFRQLDTLVILGDGRMGWLASWPGVIWKIGAFVWPFAVWRCLKKANFINVLLAFGAVLVMALDGSRTSMLWLALVWGALAMIAFFARVQTQPVRGHFSLIVVTLLSFSLIQPVLLGWVSGDYDKLLVQLMEKQTSDHPDTANLSISHTLEETLAAPKETTADRLVKGDNSIRLQMLHTGWQQTVDKFPWGGGFGSTRVDDFGTDSVIHMTYLQLLADEGVLSFIGYLLFILTPLYYGLKFVFEKRELFVERFESMLSPLSVLALFLFMGCFHPLSNELTEWAIVLTAISIVICHVPRRD